MSTIDEKLESVVTNLRNNLTTDRLDMSYGEIISMYETDEIIISPQFQRLFRWNTEKRTRFIESIILGIPITPIFVAEDNDGKWELVDGLQRISSILSFFGVLKNSNTNNRWTLEAGSLIGELEGYDIDTLPEKYIRNIKRTYCRVEIIKWDSNYDMRYELFNRLNTGGAALTDQEIRNCIFRGTSEKFNDLLKELTLTEGFRELINIGEIKVQELYEEELILRFFFFFYTDLSEIKAKNISFFMTDFMENTIKNNSFNYEEGKEIFSRTINILKLLDSNIFRFRNNQFSTSLYDSIMIGIAQNIEKYEKMDLELIKGKIDTLKNCEDFKKYIGAAASSKSRLVNRMRVSCEFFAEDKK